MLEIIMKKLYKAQNKEKALLNWAPASNAGIR